MAKNQSISFEEYNNALRTFYKKYKNLPQDEWTLFYLCDEHPHLMPEEIVKWWNDIKDLEMSDFHVYWGAV